MSTLPKTLIEAVRYFSNIAVCHEYMTSIKWSDGVVTCQKCGTEKCTEIKSRPGWLTCNKPDCRKQFSCKVGTVFGSSPLGLDKWFVAVWCIADAKNGISSHELSRSLGVTQKTAWYMIHRIREAMKTSTFMKLKGSGEIESDETFVELTKKLIQVPKEDIDAQIEHDKRERVKKLKKKKLQK